MIAKQQSTTRVAENAAIARLVAAARRKIGADKRRGRSAPKPETVMATSGRPTSRTAKMIAAPSHRRAPTRLPSKRRTGRPSEAISASGDGKKARRPSRTAVIAICKTESAIARSGSKSNRNA
ncbi:hypothetical protein D3C87_1379790 [compost metagenome]